jgi:hypothetical protein
LKDVGLVQSVPPISAVVTESQDNGIQDLARSCNVCGKETHFEPGDILYGSEWFHQLCWESGKQRSASRKEDDLNPLLNVRSSVS